MKNIEEMPSKSQLVAHRSRGLINTSNTCFMNVILQSLTGCQLFLRVIKNLSDLEDLGKYPTLHSFNQFYTEYFSNPTSNILNNNSNSTTTTSSSSTTATTTSTSNNNKSQTPTSPIQQHHQSQTNGLSNQPSVATQSQQQQQPQPPINPKHFNDLVKSFNSKVSPVPQTTVSPHSMVQVSKKKLKLQLYNNSLPQTICQQDAQEFLVFLLDLIHEEFLTLIKDIDIPKEDDKSTPTSTSIVDDNWEVVGKKGKTAIITNSQQELPKTPISQIFSGVLRSSFNRTGSKESITVEPFYCLHLDIRPEEINSLEDALKFFMKPEIIEGYTCSTKKIEISASKSWSFESLPRILIVHFKRFAFESDTSKKLDKLIRFPTQLSLSTASNHQTQKKYSLFSVVSHHGRGLSQGHYTCDIYQPQQAQWIRYDDSTFTEVKEQDVLNREAYLLLYQLVN
ncbi:ubiquitin hydrolase B [Dictyostelium discoideum AX4]|uniref:Ubiquitin hydrolase B n=1 Tax=Dictyostelium discoideum TaxID=44689 RepID=UBPB_DICDI|eukprot:XP_643807.1 ubiquitin hydrolase B [Dictyostelium discoideum AX4]